MGLEFHSAVYIMVLTRTASTIKNCSKYTGCHIFIVCFLFTARFRVKQEFILPAFTEEVPLEYLIPTTTGAGACTTALVDFLMYTHNNFIEWCISTDASRSVCVLLATLWSIISVYLSILSCFFWGV